MRVKVPENGADQRFRETLIALLSVFAALTTGKWNPLSLEVLQ
jgi:hypothetical protein